MDYKNTIITPKTAFPMKAGLPNREPGMLEKWNEMDLYGQLLEKNQDCPRFILHDGPPFSNGDIHMGHALNKTLKDFIVRARAMQGYYTPYVPGWDNHGMPIESAIIKKNKLNHKTMPVPEFRSACRTVCPGLHRPAKGAASAAWGSSATGPTPTRPWTRPSRRRR